MKATHSGHCQACGSLQKLPNGKLSLHGYKVMGGFFSGVCRGARELPFELSCDLVQTFVNEATAHKSELEAFVVKLRKPATTAKAWISNYEGHTYGRNNYKMRYVEIVETVTHYTGGSYSRFNYVANGTNGKTNVTHEVRSYTSARTLLELCTQLNAEYASRIEARDIRNLTNYIKWQSARVANWKLGALLPVNMKNDKAEFKIENEDVTVVKTSREQM
jgi:hypothetical protein